MNGLWTGKKGPFTTAKVIRNTNFRPHGVLSFDDIAEIEVEARQLEKRQLQFGDVIVEKSGGGPKQAVGRVVSFELEDGGYSFSNFTSAIRVNDPAQLHFRFLLHTLNWWYASGVTEKIQSNSTGIRNLEFSAYKALPILLPPLDEQKRIVAVLDEAFEGLSRARANAEANLADAREFFRNALAVLTNSRDFDKLPLEELCDVRDGTHDTPKYVEVGVPLVTQKNIRPDGLSLGNVKLISVADHQAISKRSNVTEGDILISMIGVNRGMSCIVDCDLQFSIKNVGLIKHTSRLNMNFLLFFLQSADAEKYISDSTNGGAQPFVGLGKLRAFPIPVPERDLQDEIASKLVEVRQDMSTLTRHYQQKTQVLATLRQSLLQKAFSGQLT